MDIHEQAIESLIPMFGSYEAAADAYQRALGEVRAAKGLTAPATVIVKETRPAGPTKAERLSAARQAVAQANPGWSSAAIDNAAQRSLATADALAARDAVLSYPTDKLNAEFDAETQARDASSWSQIFPDES